MSSDMQAAANKVSGVITISFEFLMDFTRYGRQKAALEKLRFNKSKQAARQSIPPSATTQHARTNQPPAQSHDGPISRFFSAPSPHNILVPHSSPLSQDGSSKPYEPYGYRQAHDVAPLKNDTQDRIWSPNMAFMAADSLSAPGGLRPSNLGFHASTRRQWSSNDGPHDFTQNEGPPRKRINRGQLEGSTSMSPPVKSHQPSPRPRIISDTFSISSEDSLPDASRLTGSSDARIHRKTASATDTVTDLFSDPEFIKFQLTMPTEPPQRIRAAWAQAGGHSLRASALIADPTWSSASLRSEKAERDDIGRVKEVEEATRAQKLAVKQKGKKSMIYANRITLETKAQSTPKHEAMSSVDLALTPATPVIAPRRKRLKNRIDSDSEAEDSEEDGRQMKRGRVENTDETRALDYLNTTTNEGMQELTGELACVPVLSELTVFRLYRRASECHY